MDLGLELRQAQTLSNLQIQSIEILQMSSVELAGYIEEVQMENPILEVDDPPSRHANNTLLYKSKMTTREDQNNSYYLRYDSEDWIDPLQNISVPLVAEDLVLHIELQLDGMNLSNEIYNAARFIADNLDENGYLYATVSELAESFLVSTAIMNKAFDIIRTLDPAGIGATSIKDCLDIQLLRMAGKDLHRKVVMDHLEHVSKNQYGVIAKALNVSEADVRNAVDFIKTLNPKPGAVFHHGERVSYIIPDIIIEKLEEDFEIVIDEYILPNIRISTFYKNLLDKNDDKELCRYINEKIQQARWLMANIEHRQSTLRKCAEAILEFQKEFFEGDRNRLAPLTMADLANKIGVHESTVSRAVRGKYLQCVHGVYPFQYFFTRKVGVSDTSVYGIKRLLREYINSENKHAPFSDQKIVEHFTSLGIDISRRTVAKYRADMCIPNTAGRKCIDNA